ncbi:MAG TPA: glutathione peroxidase [Gemmataceae bacterium]|nr:glutathione peroxidase [Pirellulales bacterium]HZZ79585.1 glutathione peroxidase [Gemmataceae bacterium]
MSTIYDIPLTTIDGQAESLTGYRGQVLLIVNVASRCSFTPQYAGLEALYRRHKDQGFAVLGFPCDQFLHQEPGSEAEIQGFCSSTYDVTFPMFAKVKVNGPQAHPLYQYLKRAKRGLLGTQSIKWNFGKFLIDRAGNVVRRYSMFATPERVEHDVAALL